VSSSDSDGIRVGKYINILKLMRRSVAGLRWVDKIMGLIII
jgi:hypothetical protein